MAKCLSMCVYMCTTKFILLSCSLTILLLQLSCLQSYLNYENPSRSSKLINGCYLSKIIVFTVAILYLKYGSIYQNFIYRLQLFMASAIERSASMLCGKVKSYTTHKHTTLLLYIFVLLVFFLISKRFYGLGTMDTLGQIKANMTNSCVSYTYNDLIVIAYMTSKTNRTFKAGSSLQMKL